MFVPPLAHTIEPAIDLLMAHFLYVRRAGDQRAVVVVAHLYTTVTHGHLDKRIDLNGWYRSSVTSLKFCKRRITSESVQLERMRSTCK